MCTLEEIYTNSSMTVHLHKTLETRGLTIDGEYLSHLRFADDTPIYANTPHELQHMLQELADETENQGLKMNKSKTKVMMGNDTPIYVNNTQIENVESDIHLGQRYSTIDNNKKQDKEILRRIRRFKEESWLDGQHSPSTFDIFKGSIGTCLKRKVYNSCILPAMTYGAEIWALTTQTKNNIAAAQIKMERSTLNITYWNRKTNICVREK